MASFGFKAFPLIKELIIMGLIICSNISFYGIVLGNDYVFVIYHLLILKA